MKPRTKRAGWIVAGLAALGVAAALVLNAFQSNLVFFFTPSQVASNEAPRDTGKGAGSQRCGFVAIIGAPNVGKSTLVNAMVGSKVTIVSVGPDHEQTIFAPG